jgi:hypothetical protein
VITSPIQLMNMFIISNSRVAEWIQTFAAPRDNEPTFTPSYPEKMPSELQLNTPPFQLSFNLNFIIIPIPSYLNTILHHYNFRKSIPFFSSPLTLTNLPSNIKPPIITSHCIPYNFHNHFSPQLSYKKTSPKYINNILPTLKKSPYQFILPTIPITSTLYPSHIKHKLSLFPPPPFHNSLIHLPPKNITYPYLPLFPLPSSTIPIFIHILHPPLTPIF